MKGSTKLGIAFSTLFIILSLFLRYKIYFEWINWKVVDIWGIIFIFDSFVNIGFLLWILICLTEDDLEVDWNDLHLIIWFPVGAFISFSIAGIIYIRQNIVKWADKYLGI